MCYSSKEDVYDVLVNFFNTIHLKLLKIGRLVGGPASNTQKNSLIDSHKLSLLGELEIYHNRSLFAVSLTRFINFAALLYWNFLVFLNNEW